MSKIRKNGIIAKHIYRRVSAHVVRFLVLKTQITPNQVTAVRLILSFIAAPFLVIGKHFYLLVGGVIVAAAFILDYVDGDLARLKNLESEKGKLFDVVSDRIIIIVSILSLSLGLFRNTKNIFDLLCGATIISLFYISEVIDALLERMYASSLRETFSSEIELVNKLFRRLFFENNVYYFGEDFLYSLIIIGCIFNLIRLILLLLIFYSSIIVSSCLFKILQNNRGGYAYQDSTKN